MSLQLGGIILLLFFASIVLLSMAKSIYLPGRTVFLFRALFPSWRFFEDLDQLPRLEYRYAIGDSELGEWQEALAKPKRGISTLLLNAQGNLYLACQSMLQQLESDIGDLAEGGQEEFVHSVSYRLARSLVIYRLSAAATTATSPRRFQFRVSRSMQGDSLAEPEVFLVSRIEEG